QSQDGRQLGEGFAFGAGTSARLLAAAQIEHQEDRLFTFFDVPLDEGVPHAGGHIPVDGAHVVAGLIFPDFFESQAAAAKNAAIFAARQTIDGAASANANASEMADDVRRQHRLSPRAALLRSWAQNGSNSCILDRNSPTSFAKVT